MARLSILSIAITIVLLIIQSCISEPIPELPQQKHVKRSELGVGRTGEPLPDLFTVTLDELQAGLATGAFSSVDLVKVSPHIPPAQATLSYFVLITGVFFTNCRSQSHTKRPHRNQPRSPRRSLHVRHDACQRHHSRSLARNPHHR